MVWSVLYPWIVNGLLDVFLSCWLLVDSYTFSIRFSGNNLVINNCTVLGFIMFMEFQYVNEIYYLFIFNNFILGHGAMRCLVLLSADLDDKMVPTLIPALFPSLLTIVSSPQVVFYISFWTKLATQKVWRGFIHYQKFTLFLYPYIISIMA